MAEHGLSVTAAELRERMESRFGILHYNDQYHGRHAGEFEFLETALADDIIADDGSSLGATEDTEFCVPP